MFSDEYSVARRSSYNIDHEIVEEAPTKEGEVRRSQLIVITRDLWSLDLNPIEHAWLALKRTLYKLYLEFNTIGDIVEEWVAFEAGLKEAWAAIPDSLLKKLILSMPDRLAACKAAKGY
ncbi:hypothetical protein GQ44DRAFT_714058 [Phaeosphaeriaceae sp. PMI808]|nr:hypothetical protein GQ44DRAFT_714058 [Phaeosphaeriaceae sp. PMI808]